MQWAAGNVNATTGIKGVGDFFGKAVRGSVTGESAIKPEYTGDGTLVLEPTYKHILLIDMADWNGDIVLDDGLFLACDSRLKHKAVARSTFSSAIAGGEGLFNLGIHGSGALCLESPCPREELVVIDLKDDVLKVDGNMAIAWSNSLRFTVERSSRSLIGSAPRVRAGKRSTAGPAASYSRRSPRGRCKAGSFGEETFYYGRLFPTEPGLDPPAAALCDCRRTRDLVYRPGHRPLAADLLRLSQRQRARLTSAHPGAVLLLHRAYPV